MRGKRADTHDLLHQGYNAINTIARDPATLPPGERYCCRGEMAGQWFDRAALMEVSKELGHARCNVVVSHYLWRRRS